MGIWNIKLHLCCFSYFSYKTLSCPFFLNRNHKSPSFFFISVTFWIFFQCFFKGQPCWFFSRRVPICQWFFLYFLWGFLLVFPESVPFKFCDYVNMKFTNEKKNRGGQLKQNINRGDPCKFYLNWNISNSHSPFWP